ncbi:MAG: shikimate dehydrogenase [Muribaculaceae bacterium]|nr:shikimate dehydrogenase [Muribaculaceae bacterium]
MEKEWKDTYGLVGRTLGHSFSRAYFTDKFASENINARYVNIELPEITDLLPALSKLPNLRGFNVTIPYKREVMDLLDHIDPNAAAIGAVNVVRVESDGTMTGYNTDVIGFTESIRPLVRPDVKSALVLGVGGATRAVVAGLRSLGIEPVTVSRRPGAGDLTWNEVTADVIAEHKVIVNCTPLGTWPDVDTAPDLPYEAITPSHVCFDLVYNPAETLFLRRAAARGAATRNGLEMLRLQADAAWRLWTIREPVNK